MERIINSAELVVAAWGNHGGLNGRAREVVERFDVEWHALGVNQTGHPVHPGRYAADAEPEVFSYG